VTYCFGSFSVDCDTRQLVARGSEIHVSPKAFELLRMLIAHRERAVSKAELQEWLWPSTFVGETNLTTLVAEIRRALNDTAREPQYVRTVHRFGYRFVAPVSEMGRGIVASEPGTRMYLTTADRYFPLQDGAFVIGRARDAAIRIDAGGVSRHHARVVVAGDEARVEDLGSKNGTFVDGAAVTSACLLRDGGEVRVGPVALTFRIALPTQVTETMG
jgi:DNA-binding winged helix-turn-helix (wHTH) protein